MTADNSSSLLFARLNAYSKSRSALAIAFLWGMAEATLFFIVPDVYLGFVALFNWRRGLLATVFTIIGAMIGGAIMYSLALNNPQGMAELLTRVPLIHANMANSVGEQMQLAGLNPLILGPLKGIPYKVYAVQAGALGLPFLPFLLLTILARLERILPFVLVSACVGVLFRNFIQQRTRLVIGLYAALWLGIYGIYYLRFR